MFFQLLTSQMGSGTLERRWKKESSLRFMKICMAALEKDYEEVGTNSVEDEGEKEGEKY